MTNSETTVLETDAIIFPLEFGQDKNKTDADIELSAATVAEKQPATKDVLVRFARLRKSLRKRSVSIL